MYKSILEYSECGIDRECHHTPSCPEFFTGEELPWVESEGEA